MDENRSSRKIAKSMLSVFCIVILAKVIGFAKQMVTANAFGATIHTDIIFLAEGIVSNVDYLLIQALSTAFIPIYMHAVKKEEKEGMRFVSNAIKFFFLITVAIAILLFFSSPVIAKIIAPSYTDELSQSLSCYIKVCSPVLILIVELSIFNSLLKANKQFVLGEFIGFNQGVIIIILVFLFENTIGPDTLIVGFYLCTFFNLFFLMVHSYHFWSITGKYSFSDSNLKKMIRMMGPLLLGYSVVFVNQQVDKIIISGFPAGTITAMNYASVLSNFVTTFIGSICGVLFTYVAQNIAEEKMGEAAYLTNSFLLQMVTLFLPVSILTIMNSVDIVQIVFGRGKFDSDAVASCAIALVGYSYMFVPFVVRELYSRFQYAYEDSKRPMINSTIAIVVNIILSIVLSNIMGVLGVTLATSISVAVCGVLNYLSSKEKNDVIRITGNHSILMRWIFGIGTCIAISYFGQKYMLEIHVFVRFVVIVLISMLTYGIIVFPIIKPLLQRQKDTY